MNSCAEFLRQRPLLIGIRSFGRRVCVANMERSARSFACSSARVVMVTALVRSLPIPHRRTGNAPRADDEAATCSAPSSGRERANREWSRAKFASTALEAGFCAHEERERGSSDSIALQIDCKAVNTHTHTRVEPQNQRSSSSPTLPARDRRLACARQQMDAGN